LNVRTPLLYIPECRGGPYRVYNMVLDLIDTHKVQVLRLSDDTRKQQNQ